MSASGISFVIARKMRFSWLVGTPQTVRRTAEDSIVAKHFATSAAETVPFDFASRMRLVA